MSAPIRLAREAPAARRAGYTAVLGLFLSVLGGVTLLLLKRTQAMRADPNNWGFYVVGGGFFLVGLVLLVLSIKMSLALRLPETIVEVDRRPVRAGQPFHVTVRQPGPIRLNSLRLNLVGEQVTKREVWRNGRRRIETDRRLIHQNNVVDLKDLTILSGNEIAHQAEATVPANVRLVDIEGRTHVVWRLEVWGRVPGWVDFGHPFLIDVSTKATRSHAADR
jgi:hypothetical protein